MSKTDDALNKIIEAYYGNILAVRMAIATHHTTYDGMELGQVHADHLRNLNEKLRTLQQARNAEIGQLFLADELKGDLKRIRGGDKTFLEATKICDKWLKRWEE